GRRASSNCTISPGCLKARSRRCSTCMSTPSRASCTWRRRGSTDGSARRREMSEMTAERWRRVQDLFAGVLEQPEQARVSFLAGACGGDAELMEEVSALVEGAPSAAAHLRNVVTSAVESLGAGDAATRIGMQVGPYRLTGVLGAGG